MAKPNFPEKIWDGRSSDRKRRDFIRSPSANDYEQAIVEIQALQVQVAALLQRLQVTPVYSMDEIIAKVLISADKKYVTPDAPVLKNPLPRVPNTFIWIDQNGLGASLTPQEVLTWVRADMDQRYLPKGTTFAAPISLNDVLAVTDTKYMMKDFPVITKAQADSYYMPVGTVLFTKQLADTLYAPITLVAKVNALPSYTEGDKRWKLKAEK